jgi:hypothetical protein
MAPEAPLDIEELVEVREDLDENEAVTGSHPHAFPVAADTRLVPLGRAGREGGEGSREDDGSGARRQR